MIWLFVHIYQINVFVAVYQIIDFILMFIRYVSKVSYHAISSQVCVVFANVVTYIIDEDFSCVKHFVQSNIAVEYSLALDTCKKI